MDTEKIQVITGIFHGICYGNRTEECNSVCNHTSDKQNRTTAQRESDLFITSMITD